MNKGRPCTQHNREEILGRLEESKSAFAENGMVVRRGERFRLRWRESDADGVRRHRSLVLPDSLTAALVRERLVEMRLWRDQCRQRQLDEKERERQLENKKREKTRELRRQIMALTIGGLPRKRKVGKAFDLAVELGVDGVYLFKIMMPWRKPVSLDGAVNQDMQDIIANVACGHPLPPPVERVKTFLLPETPLPGAHELPPDWRRQAAQELLTDPRLYSVDMLARQDPMVMELAHFMQRCNEASCIWEEQGQLFRAFPVLSVAYDLCRDQPNERHLIEALLLAGEGTAKVAEILEMPGEIVRCYRECFFEVEGRLEDAEWLRQFVFLPVLEWRDECFSEGLIWKMLGWALGPDAVLEAVDFCRPLSARTERFVKRFIGITALRNAIENATGCAGNTSDFSKFIMRILLDARVPARASSDEPAAAATPAPFLVPEAPEEPEEQEIISLLEWLEHDLAASA